MFLIVKNMKVWKGWIIMTKTYDIEVDCAVCAQKVEDTVNATEGVKEAVVSFMTQKLKIEFEDGVDEAEVMKQVIKRCKKAVSDAEIYCYIL